MAAMDVTPQELRSSEIKDSWRGYDRDEVDDLLERAAVTIESLTQKLQEAASRPAPAAPRPHRGCGSGSGARCRCPSSREDADMLQRTLLLAQRAADDAVNEAQARARQILEESEAKAQSLVSDAEATARRIAEGERRRLEAEILDLSARREQLRADADALDAYASGYRDRLRAAIESDLANLGGEVEPPAPRPELHDVDLPAARCAGRDRRPASDPVDAEAEEAVHEVQSDQSAWDPGPDTRALGAVDAPSTSGSVFAAEASASSSPVAAPPRPTSAESAPPAAEWPPPAPAPEASTSAPPADSSWLSSDDDWAPASSPPGMPPRRGSATPRPTSRSRPTCRWRPTPSTPTRSTTTRSSPRCARRCATTPRSGRATTSRPRSSKTESEQDRRRFRRRR